MAGSPRNSVYRRMTAMCDQVADAALRGAQTAELATVFSQTIHKPVLLLDPQFGLTTQAGQPGPWDPAEAGIAQLLRALAAERRPLRIPPVPGSALSQGCLAVPVTVGETLLGYLLVLDQTGAADPDDADLVITRYAATLFALTLAREQTTLELGLRYQGTIINSLVSGHFLDRSDARHKARECGLTDGQSFHVAVARPAARSSPPASASPPADTAAQSVLGQIAASITIPFVVRGKELVMIVPQPLDAPAPAVAHDPGGGPPLAALNKLTAGTRSTTPGVTCGVSELLTAPELAPHGLRQAEQAIELGTRLNRDGQLIRYEELGIYRLLLQIGDIRQLSRFAAEILGPLLDYDATHKVDLINTLSTFLSQHESLKQTARLLRVHVNTVAYRIQRIQQLATLDLADPEERLLAHVAMKIIEMHGTSDQGTELSTTPWSL
jgi:PucR family transcriptional regulator, purine catabolism regulatory protein